MQLTGVQVAVLLLGITVFGVAGMLNGMASSQTTANSDRLVEIAWSYAEAIASDAASGGSVVASTFTLTDTRLGVVTVNVSSASSTVIVTASAQGITREAEAETQ